MRWGLIVDDYIIPDLPRSPEQIAYEKFLTEDGLPLLAAFRSIRCPKKRAGIIALVVKAARDQNH